MDRRMFNEQKPGSVRERKNPRPRKEREERVISTKGRCVQSTWCDPAGEVRNEAGDSSTSEYQDLGGQEEEFGVCLTGGEGARMPSVPSS